MGRTRKCSCISCIHHIHVNKCREVRSNALKGRECGRRRGDNRSIWLLHSEMEKFGPLVGIA